MLGSAILRMFHQQHELHFTARNTVIAKQLTDQLNVTPHLINLEDKSAVHEVCQGMDGIIHCAALSSPWGKWEAFYQSNVDATKTLSARRMHIRYHVLSISPPPASILTTKTGGTSEKQTMLLRVGVMITRTLNTYLNLKPYKGTAKQSF